MKKFLLGISFFGLALVLIPELTAQCKSWNELESGDKDQAENLHVTYRDYIKAKNFKEAFPHWEKAFNLAPAADGNRDWHYMDGVAIYKDFFANESDAAKKEEYKNKALDLYDQAIACYEANTITVPRCNEDKCRTEKIGLVYGQKAFDMYYTFNTPYPQTLEALGKAIELGGNATLYSTFAPYANIVVYQYQKEKMSKEEAREVYEELNAIADYNAENNDKYGEYYQQAKDAMNAKFGEIENEIFDCDFFKKKLEPQFRENMDDPEIVKYVYQKLLQQGCDKEDPLMAEIDAKWKAYAEEENARRMAEFEANNPGFAAKKLYDQEDFEGAIAKYMEAIESEEDDAKKAEYYFSIASIQFRKLDQYNSARSSAREAAKLNPNWGRPLILIGEMYARSSSSCGSDAFERGLAVIAAINKWAQAKSVDPEVAEDANGLIGRYSKYKPPKDDVFMRKADGKTFKVPCWIGESVKVTL